jgi:homocysteine S-methyltransferase
MITILDGGMGQELVARSTSAPTPLWSARVMLDAPDLVRAVHDDFFAAGAMVATANTYAVHRDRLAEAGLEDRFEALHRSACQVACAARDAAGGGRVAGAIGPLGGSYRADPLPGDAEARFAEICRLQAPFVDILLLETVSALDQMRAALAGAAGQGRPVWLSLSVDDEDGRYLRSGASLEDALAEADAADAILVNCSAPEAVSVALEVLRGCDRPFGAYANGFTGIAPRFLRQGATVRDLAARRDLTPEAYADFAEDWARMGATLIGGCCEIGPAHVAELARRLT